MRFGSMWLINQSCACCKTLTRGHEEDDMVCRVPNLSTATGELQGARVLVAVVAVAVGMALADSAIVVLALPQLYGQLHTSIVGVSWVVTAYNVAVAVAAFAIVLFVHRLRARTVLAAGLIVFLAASVACALADSIAFLVAARCVQGAGAALLMVGSLPVLAALTGSAVRGATVWTLAGTVGIALGPVLGGVLTQAFEWRAIFIVQAPVAALALVAAFAAPTAAPLEEGWRPALAATLPANVCLALIFGALVGVLFLAVLLVIAVWNYAPIAGAGIVSVLPLATVAAGSLGRRLAPLLAVCSGAILLALGLLGLAFLPSSSLVFAMVALALGGVGIGLSVPALSHAALDPASGLVRSGTLTIGIRQLGLVLAVAAVAPLLAGRLPNAGDRALLRATSVLLDAPVGLTTKLPVAYDLAREFDRARTGQTPDLARPFDAHGAAHDPALASVRDRLVGTVEETITRAFRPAFLFCAALALLVVPIALLFRNGVVR